MKLNLHVAFLAVLLLAGGVLAGAAAQSTPNFEPPSRQRLPSPDLPRPMIPRSLLDPSEEGAWIPVCITELRYMNLSGPYGLTGFGRDPTGNYVHFTIGKSGIKMKIGTTTSIAPYLLPASEWFLPEEQPDLWSFFREAAEEAMWVDFWAWGPNSDGLRLVTQVRRAYPAGAASPCPPAS